MVNDAVQVNNINPTWNANLARTQVGLCRGQVGVGEIFAFKLVQSTDGYRLNIEMANRLRPQVLETNGLNTCT